MMRNYAAILNSRQSRYPCGADTWVKNTVAAVKDAIERGCIVLSSSGMNTHELVLWAANRFGGEQLIVCPIGRNDDEQSTIDAIADNFRLDRDRARFRFVRATGRSMRETWRTRDEIMINIANRIYPISLRKESTLKELLAQRTNCETIRTFECEYAPHNVPQYELDFDAIEQQYPSQDWKYLTHWTHSHSGPWQHENKADYYEALINSGDENPRSARATLKRITETCKIAASSAMVRGDTPIVSFTEHAPATALKLLQWRTGLGRYNFEPFGVAVDKAAAQAMGTKPVIYGSEELYRSMPMRSKPFFQPDGKGGRWHSEKEWRYVGDFDLARLPESAYFFIWLG